MKTVKYDDDDEDFLHDNDDNNYQRRMVNQEEQDDVAYDELKDTAGVKVIRFDEDIKKVMCSRNTSAFGYIAIIGTTKMSIFLAYADEVLCIYDHSMTLNQWDLRMNSAGSRVELIDFSDSGESFFTYSTTSELAVWSLKSKKCIESITKIALFDSPWS